MRMFFAIICLMGILSNFASEYNIPPCIRFTLERDIECTPIVYYFSFPNEYQETYPILLLCEGSSSKNDLESVYFIREWFSDRIQPLNVGYLTIEKWGIDGNHINETEFWNHYSRSQRLSDHLKIINYFNKNPPTGWNGQFIFVGVSEGGALVTDLSSLCPNTLATINFVGAGDWKWADQFWQFFEHLNQNTSHKDMMPSHYGSPYYIPASREEYDMRVQKIINDPSPNKWMGGMTYTYLADAFTKSPIDYSKIHAPFLVVKGTEDSDISSCDDFVYKAWQAGAPVTYFRVDGMDHWLRKRPDIINQSFDWLKERLE